MADNPYLDQICANLPRILALFDADRTSSSYGMGDRYYWAWGLIDFGNATFQGAAHGMARLWRAGLWPFPTSKEHFYERMDAMFEAAKRLTRKNGSLEEAFPNEGSYCVTALVAYDLLCTTDLLKEGIPEDKMHRWTATIAPMIEYLIRADETHAIVSNHLAAAVGALLRWHRLTGHKTATQKARFQLDKILHYQSKEGWFKEYEGADPGYQSLCTYFLADVHKQRPDWGLLEPLCRSIHFLWHFAHPDGSFGGLYGSRCTRFYYPAGVKALAKQIPQAAALDEFMANSIAQKQVVTLSTMDEPNLIPMFNAYVLAAVIEKERQTVKKPESLEQRVPCKERQPMRRHYPKAGLWLDRGSTHYTIISTHKGGVLYHFSEGNPPIINAGVVVRHPHARLGSTQSYNSCNIVHQQGDQLEITSQISAMPKRLPDPFQFIILRLLSITVFHSAVVREWIKRCLVNLLITRRPIWPIRNLRIIRFGKELTVKDKTFLAPGYEVVKHIDTYVPIHMASQGYWQSQDEEGYDS